MFHLPISWEELIRGSVPHRNESNANSLVRPEMIGEYEQARKDEQRTDDYRNRFWCVVLHGGEGCNEIAHASSLRLQFLASDQLLG